MMKRILPISLCLLLPALADGREWRNVEGTRSFEADFVSRCPEKVKLRKADGAEFELELARLHADDVAWLDDKHPLPGSVPPPDAVFDHLRFGDDRETVLRKLRASEIVEMVVDETHIGRFGLNGVFCCKHRVGDMKAWLYFDWTKGGTLKEVSLQTEGQPEESYDGKLHTAWKDFIPLLTTLYGRPAQNGAYPQKRDLEDGTFLASHLWRLAGGGSMLLGSAREGNGYMIVVRFTREIINPVRVP